LTYRIGTLFLDIGQFEKGLALCRSLPWKTHALQRYVGISRAHIETDEYDKAKKFIDKGLRKFPKSEALWFNLGTLYHITKDYLRSLKCYERGLEIVPWNELMINGKANALHGLGYYVEAVKLYHDLSTKHPESPGYAISCGWCYIEMGRPEEAFPVFRKVSDNFDMADAYHGLYWAYTDMGLSNDALDIIQEGLSTLPDEEARLYVDIGYEYWSRGWKAKAKDILEKGLEIFPGDEDILDLLRQIDDYPDNSDDDTTPYDWGPNPGRQQEARILCCV
jgi:tetratricopeptide (TPR) repeat protein